VPKLNTLDVGAVSFQYILLSDVAESEFKTKTSVAGSEVFPA